jgi:hypothetical protein
MKKLAMLTVAALMSAGLCAGNPAILIPLLSKSHGTEATVSKKQKEKKQRHEKRAEKARPAHKK